MKLLGFDPEDFASKLMKSINSRSIREIDATVEVYQSLISKILRNQDLAVDRMRQLETKASWLLPAYLIILTFEYEHLNNSNLNLGSIWLCILTGLFTMFPLFYVIYPKDIEVSDRYEDIVEESNSNHKKSSFVNNFVDIELASIKHTEQVTGSIKKKSRLYRRLIISSSLLLILHWGILIGILIGKG